MGIYDIYGGVQLKVGDIFMTSYKIGDKVQIPDGIYVGYGGNIVIKDGIFIAEFPHLTTKWGNPINQDSIMGHLSPYSSDLLDAGFPTMKSEESK